MRTIKKIHQAESAPIADLQTYRALPTRFIDFIDPFLFLNHHGHQGYPKKITMDCPLAITRTVALKRYDYRNGFFGVWRP